MADITHLADELRKLKAHYSTIPGGEQQMYAHVADYAQRQGLGADVVAQVAQSVAPNPGLWTTDRVQTLMNNRQADRTSAEQNANVGRFGLGPAQQTLSQGAADATQRIGQTQQQVSGLYNQAQGYLNPYMQGGGQAHDLQAALSGAMGREAQQQAFSSYESSPGVQFAQKEAERALLRNASAMGGLGGGNIMRDLSQLAAGTAMQDFGNQFSRLGEVANRGYGAATTGAGLKGQEAGMQSGLGQFAANIPLQTSQAQAGMQFQAGRDIASSISSATSALSNLINQQGQGMANITGGMTTNLSNLYQLASAGDAQAMEQLGTLIGNISTQNASLVGGQPIIPSAPTNYLGQLGQITGAVGGLVTGLGQFSSTSPATQSVYGANSAYTNAPYMGGYA